MVQVAKIRKVTRMVQVAKIRKARGLSQTALARKLDLSVAAVAAWEVGRSMPKPETLCKLADVLECSVDEILGRKEVS